MSIDATKIPYVELTGIKQNGDKLFLKYKDDVLNHVKTIHACAQFTLAETTSGVFLQKLFPQLENRAVPLLRSAKIKYLKPAQKKIYGYASIKQEDAQKFQEQFAKKRRALIEMSVEIRDEEETSTCRASFSWFIQSI